MGLQEIQVEAYRQMQGVSTHAFSKPVQPPPYLMHPLPKTGSFRMTDFVRARIAMAIQSRNYESRRSASPRFTSGHSAATME